MVVRSKFSKKKGNKINTMLSEKKRIPLNDLLPFAEGGKIPVNPENAVTTDATRQGLQNLEILNSGVFDPAKLQTVQDDFMVTGPGGSNQLPLNQARDFNNPEIRSSFEKARTTDQNAPFFNQTKSRARKTYLDLISNQATDQRTKLLDAASRPENFSNDLLQDDRSEFFDPDRAQDLKDLQFPSQLEEVDPIFQNRRDKLEENNPAFFTKSRFGSGGSLSKTNKMPKLSNKLLAKQDSTNPERLNLRNQAKLESQGIPLTDEPINFKTVLRDAFNFDTNTLDNIQYNQYIRESNEKYNFLGNPAKVERLNKKLLKKCGGTLKKGGKFSKVKC